MLRTLGRGTDNDIFYLLITSGVVVDQRRREPKAMTYSLIHTKQREHLSKWSVGDVVRMAILPGIVREI